ncbi:MAG: thioredoxin family protein [Kiloniellales bacterium]
MILAKLGTHCLRSLGAASLLAAAGAVSLQTGDAAATEIGAAAPDFTAVDSYGTTHRLSDYRGKTVVLEWTNDGCPYVRKHYGTDNMQALQRDATDAGIVWLSVISSPPGTQGYAEPDEANRLTAERDAAPSAVLLDPKGEVGRAYDARVTPHMYIIDPAGRLVYKGGIDDKPTTRPADVETANNYVRAALADLAAGRPVAEAVTRPYGCTVKYVSPSS